MEFLTQDPNSWNKRTQLPEVVLWLSHILVVYAPTQNKLIKYFKMGSSFHYLASAGGWGWGSTLKSYRKGTLGSRNNCSLVHVLLQSQVSVWKLLLGFSRTAQPHTPTILSYIDPATVRVPSTITLGHISLDENCKHNEKSPQRAAHVPLAQNPTHRVRNLIHCSLWLTTFCQPELWKGNLGSRWGGLSTAFSSFLVTFPPFSVHSWVGWRPGTFTFSCFPRRGVYMRPRQSYPVFAAWGGQAGWAVPSAGWRATLLGTVFPLGCSCSQQDRGWHRAGVGVGACLLFLCFCDKQV